MVTVAMSLLSRSTSPVDSVAVNVSVSSAIESSMMGTLTLSSVSPGASATTLELARKSEPSVKRK